jgi:ketosteroid isomerase-like protein
MRSAIERVLAVFPDPGPDGVDFKAFIEQEDLWARTEGLIADDAPIRFITPDGGFMGGMAGPFNGREGFRAGWREWIRAWDTFVARIDETYETEDGSWALLLVMSIATMEGVGTRIEQPAAALYELDGDQITAIDHYLDHDQARRAFEEGPEQDR